MSEISSKKKIIVSSDEDSEDESGSFLEESPCGRWVKRKEIVDQRNIPGIDSAHLAMDTEEGVEVVWNEVHFSERQNFKTQQERMQIVFEHIIHLDHPNIVKFHHYWTDTHSEIPRLIFITEYMSLGSLKMFLKRAKLSVKRLSLQAWKRWCTQILSALSYLHSSSPPIIHGNLTCDTIFIQHNGLVKIGSVAPDSIHKQFKRCWLKNMHFIAPEFGTAFSPAVDIYSFGMCALEMVALDIQGNGDFGNIVTNEIITRTINSLEDSQQKDFIMRCVDKQHTNRPSARELLFHPLLFEVHSLKLLAAHCLVKSSSNISETITDDLIVKLCMPDDIIAEIIHKNGHGRQIRLMDIPIAEKLEKYVEDVKNGIYPLIAFGEKLPPSRSMVLETPVTVVPEPEPQPEEPVELLFEVPEPQPEEPVELLFEVPEPQPKEPVELLFEVPEPEVTSYAAETRRIRTMECTIQQDEHELEMKLLLLMDDNVNRQVSCKVIQGDSAVQFAEELEQYGFINKLDCDNVTMLIESAFRKMAQQSNIEEAMQNLSMENSPHPVQESQSTTRNEDDLPQSPETAAENELLLQPSTSATKQLMKLLPSKEKDLDKLSWKTLITIANGLFNPHKRKRLLHAITNIMENDMEHDSE